MCRSPLSRVVQRRFGKSYSFFAYTAYGTLHFHSPLIARGWSASTSHSWVDGHFAADSHNCLSRMRTMEGRYIMCACSTVYELLILRCRLPLRKIPGQHKCIHYVQLKIGPITSHSIWLQSALVAAPSARVCTAYLCDTLILRKTV